MYTLTYVRACGWMDGLSVLFPLTTVFFSLQARGSIQVVLDARTQLGYMPKTKTENIKSFGDIFHQMLQTQCKDQ